MKGIIFLYYRAGSTMFQIFCEMKWRDLQRQGLINEAIAEYNKWRKTGRPFTILTNPSAIVEDNGISFQEAYDRYKGFPNFLYMTHIGDWWGQCSSDLVPDPFEGNSPTRWGPNELKSLPELEDWKFVSLIRDGRNQIESLRLFTGGIEEERNRKDPEDYFKFLCKAYRNRARIVLSCKEEFPNRYKWFKFEDLLIEPESTMKNIFNHFDLDFDTSNIKNKNTNEGMVHSSFENTRYNKRWYSWSEEEKDLFETIAGKENKELGYL